MLFISLILCRGFDSDDYKGNSASQMNPDDSASHVNPEGNSGNVNSYNSDQTDPDIDPWKNPDGDSYGKVAIVNIKGEILVQVLVPVVE